jgi:hypothetical protein
MIVAKEVKYIERDEVIKRNLCRGIAYPDKDGNVRINHYFSILECSDGNFRNLLRKDFVSKVMERERPYYKTPRHSSRKRWNIRKTIKEIVERGEEKFEEEYKLLQKIKEIKASYKKAIQLRIIQ